MSDNDVVDLYVEALAAFGTVVQDLADHEWDLPTPATEWNVKQLVAHVVFGEAQLPTVLDGQAADTQASFNVEMLGSSPIAAWRGTALRAIEAAKAPGIADKVLELDRGSVAVRDLLGYRITDNVVHAWDLLVAAGRPEPIREDLAEWLLDFWKPKAAQLTGTEFFAAPTQPQSDSPSDRLLALLGRSAPPAD
ncbi:hypothetical protein GQR58_029793 [Nymphon striatum]|nr:hypothetical protein GQR58_029793 [Nymphon striatum]